MSNGTAANFNPEGVPSGRGGIAQLIVEEFADAGFGAAQQLAALANAIAESGLNPQAKAAPPEEGVGLFQINSKVGLGAGHTVEQLTDPKINIGLIVGAAKKFPDFAAAPSLSDAVQVFVRKIMRPANPGDEIPKRLKIAERLAPKAGS